MPDSEVFTTNTAAKRCGVAEWQVRRLFERGLLPEPPRAGAYRLIPADDLPKIETALRAAGYLREVEVAAS